jgi:pterin-4a-carbinolamine dehydratase
MFSLVPRRYFAFFNKKISTKASDKCCRYNQDGKPLDKETVIKHTQGISKFIEGWQFNDEYTRMYRMFYARDYLMAIQFVKDIAKMDALTSRNCPSFNIKGGDFVKVELYSPSLDGLSQVDFRLAMEINNMKIDDYFLVPVEKEKNYRREAKLKLRDKESDELQQKLAQDEGSKKTDQTISH